MKQGLAITRKELAGYFGSPMALIFVGAFLAVTLFAFFWVDTFFARGIADARPLFHWMPLLLIFLVAALTMRQWSEEQRSGTMEVLLTLPVSPVQLVLGKFLAVMALVLFSLVLTAFLPITVAILGNLDAGPVVGGYIAALLLAAAYTAIGLLISSRTDNQIVALILTLLFGGLLYLVGTPAVTGLIGGGLAAFLRGIGSGSRFESIQRGVVDLRDLAYYLALAGIFLALNVLSLDSKRWSKGKAARPHRQCLYLTTALVVVNLLVVNVWLSPLAGLRLDLTAQREYSLSATTRDLLSNLQEPLIIRGYFSEKTHPLLAPLVPGIEDMLQEYRAASGGKVDLQIIDPTKDPEAEAEANQLYGITPDPFQVTGRYETAIVNSYFHILIRYGDQNVVLGFRDLVEVEAQTNGGVAVRLRNLEYDLTRSIKKVVYGFQSVSAMLTALPRPAEVTLYVTPNTLPADLADIPATIQQVADDIAASASGHFTYQVVDPDAPGSPVTRQQLYDQYGIQALPVSLFSSQDYYLHVTVRVGDKVALVYPQYQMTAADVRSDIESALKRVSPGFLKVVGLWVPQAQPTQDMFGQVQQPLSSWEEVRTTLAQEYEVRTVDLQAGRIPEDIAVLVLVAPQGLSDEERLAVDQYLMRGGAVVVAAGNYGVQADPYSGGLAAQPLAGGLQDMLAAYGIYVPPTLVMDPQNEPFPMYVEQNVGGVPMQQVVQLPYPFFVDVRRDAMAAGNPIVSNLSMVTLNWASPISVSSGLNATVLLRSSSKSWLSYDSNIQPNFDLYPQTGFPPATGAQSYPLAIAVQGVFQSAFKDKTLTPTGGVTSTLIPSSPDTARLVVIGSGEFLDDFVFQVSQSLSGDRYLNSLKLVQNAVSWATEDSDLLSIRARGSFARVLNPLTTQEESGWEIANMLVALFMLVAIGVVWTLWRRRERPMVLRLPGAGAARGHEEVGR
jgi:ABC-2 type transport system permease protein